MNEYDTKTMNELLSNLAQARETEKKARNNIQILTEAIKTTPEYQDNDSIRVVAQSAIENLEGLIRDLAKTEWINTANKHPHEKVQIKEFKTFKIVDTAAVRKWVDTYLRDALVVDESKVKQYATKIGPVDGTEVGTEVRAEIASKL